MKLQVFASALCSILLCVGCSSAQRSGRPNALPEPQVLKTAEKDAAPAPQVLKPTEKKAPFVTWDKKTIELGKVKKGEQRKMFYEMENSSGEPIQIEIVDACECTKVDFPRSVVPPGEKRRLDVVFDSSEKESGETIGITIVFKNMDEKGNPRIESINYSFEIEK
jgi:Protein of unknown function (DUF1573)